MIGSGGGVVLVRVSLSTAIRSRVGWQGGWVRATAAGTARQQRAGCQLGSAHPRWRQGKGSAADVDGGPYLYGFTVLWVRPSTKTGNQIEVLISKPFAVNCRKVSTLLLDGDLSSFANLTAYGLWSLCARRSLSLWQSSSVHLI